MKDKKGISPIYFLLLGAGMLLYSLVDSIYQLKGGHSIRITTIILFVYAAFTFYIVFSIKRKK